jgi:hypothetical protein
MADGSDDGRAVRRLTVSAADLGRVSAVLMAHGEPPVTDVEIGEWTRPRPGRPGISAGLATAPIDELLALLPAAETRMRAAGYAIRRMTMVIGILGELDEADDGTSAE